jgi:uncharacterized protein
MREPPREPRVESLPPNARFDIGERQYPRRYRFSDIAIRMSDDAVLSADLTLPGDQRGPAAGPLPVVLNFTPYNKMLPRFFDGSRMRALGNWIGPSNREHLTGRDLLRALAGGTLVSRGYAYLMVDVRGTGTSTGHWDLFGENEQRDYLEVLRWAREQPWCNGQLAVRGISYGALAALIIAGLQPDGLMAIFAIEGAENAVREFGLPGGVPSRPVAIWLATVNMLKWIPSIGGLIKTGTWRRCLRDRVQEPFSWIGHTLKIALVSDHPDIYLNAMWASRIPQLDKITVPTWIHGGWHDVYARSNFRMYDRIATRPGAKQVLVDDSYHTGPGSGFGAPDAPQYLDELQCAWFDRWVKGIDNGIDRYGPITVRRLGGGWVSHNQYPDPTARVRRLYLSADASGFPERTAIDASLVARAPEHKQRLPVPAGRNSIRSSNSSDDRDAEATAVTFTTKPFDADVVLSGPLNLHLWVEAEGSDAFWSVTVTDVEPTGVSAEISRGALLSSLRAIDEATSTYVDGELLVAEHPFTAASVLPVVPGQPFDVDIDINATEAVIRAGHRLRVAISRTSFPHLFSRSQRRKIKGQTIIVDPAHLSYLTFLAVAAS